MKIIDLSGRVYGSLTVIERAESRTLPCGQKLTMWYCKCDCGKITVVSGSNLKSGNVKSCGCHKSASISKKLTRHGYGGTRLYQEWRDMVRRCKTDHHYKGKGISVCSEWVDNVTAFCKWAIANGYSDNLELDRIDNDGNYEPSNCRWVTRKEQMNNYSRNVLIAYNGKVQTISQWADEIGMSYDKLYNRLYRHWDIEKALNTP